MKRIQLSFSKGKTKKVKKLGDYNQQLQEILGYSERIVPIADARTSTQPVAWLEKIRHTAIGVHNILRQQYFKCSGHSCRSHQALVSLRATPKDDTLNMLFILQIQDGKASKPLKQVVDIQPSAEEVPIIMPEQISNVGGSKPFRNLQLSFQAAEAAKPKRTLFGMLSKKPKKKVSRGSSANANYKPLPSGPPSGAASQTPSITVTAPSKAGKSRASPARVIYDLCGHLRNPPPSKDWILVDQHARQYKVTPPRSLLFAAKTGTKELISLHQLLDAHEHAKIDI